MQRTKALRQTPMMRIKCETSKTYTLHVHDQKNVNNCNTFHNRFPADFPTEAGTTSTSNLASAHVLSTSLHVATPTLSLTRLPETDAHCLVGGKCIQSKGGKGKPEPTQK